MNVHHKFYDGRDLWDYADPEMELLCRKCHAEEHGKPDIQIKLTESLDLFGVLPIQHRTRYLLNELIKQQIEKVTELEAKIQQKTIDYYRVEADWYEKTCLLEGSSDILTESRIGPYVTIELDTPFHRALERSLLTFGRIKPIKLDDFLRQKLPPST